MSDEIEADLHEAFEDGADRRACGDGLRDNPFAPGTRLHAVWQAGWHYENPRQKDLADV